MDEDQNSEQQEETPSEEPKRSTNPVMVAGVVVLFFVLAGGYLLTRGQSDTPSLPSQPKVIGESDTKRDETTDDSSETKTDQENEVEDNGSDDPEVKIIDVEAGSFYYKPNVIKVKSGEKVKIVLTAKDMMHDFNIDELGLTIPITTAGKTGTVEFTAGKAGEYEFYCSVGNHRQQGQVGKLVVE